MTDICLECRRIMKLHKVKFSSIAAATGLAESTIRSALSEGAKSPSIQTIGPICAFLGVSMDTRFGIAPSSKRLLDQRSIDIIIDYYRRETVIRSLQEENLRLRKLASRPHRPHRSR